MLEQQRDGAALERGRRERVRLELERAVQQGGQLSGREVGAGEEVARQARECKGVR
jgi:hypothetical protein